MSLNLEYDVKASTWSEYEMVQCNDTEFVFKLYDVLNEQNAEHWIVCMNNKTDK